MSAPVITLAAGVQWPLASHQESVVHGPRSERVLHITLGKSKLPLGVLQHFQDGPDECSRLRFHPGWIGSPRCFDLSPDLRRHTQDQWRKPPFGRGSPFFAALTDTLPQGFSRSILTRSLGAGAVVLEQLCAVDDVCRLGALRIHTSQTERSEAEGWFHLPHLADLDAMAKAVAAFEQGTADLRQTQLLMSSATALGGSRPKVSFMQMKGVLAVARLPSVFDDHSVARVEMLTGLLAQAAGIHVARMELKNLCQGAALMVERLDRSVGEGRSPYFSARSLLLAEGDDELSCLDLLDVMRARCRDFVADARQLWRRQMFRLLINNADGSLLKIGFVYDGHNRWRLAPATGLRPSLERGRHAATPCIPELGPGCDIDGLLRLSSAFELSQKEAREVLSGMVGAISRWRAVAEEFPVRASAREMNWLEAAMSNVHIQQAREMVAGRR